MSILLTFCQIFSEIGTLTDTIATLENKLQSATTSEHNLRAEVETIQNLMTRDQSEVLILRERVSELESENAKVMYGFKKFINNYVT